MSEDTRPAVLILGGLSTVSRHLVAYLCGDEGEVPSPTQSPLVKYLRIADRFSVQPATTYLDSAFRRCLDRSFVEYRQANLSVASKVAEVFTLPEGIQSWDYIFDVAIGETRTDRPEVIHVQQTYTLPLELARYASTIPHRAYVRLTWPYYVQSNSVPGGYTERFVESSDNAKKDKKGGLFRSKEKKSDGLGPKPDDMRGRWWHELIRAQAAIPNLNYAVVRVAEAYGEAYMEGQVLARLVIAHIYRFKGEEMRFLHNPDLRLHTVHIRDIARALATVAGWIADVGREKANSVAGEEIPSAWTWSTGKDGDEEKQGMKLAADLPDAAARIVAPYFNVVDDNDTTQDKLAKACGECFGVKHGFHNAMISSLVTSFNRTDFTHLVDDINEDHMEAWEAMMASSTPPIPHTSISPFLTEDSFRKKAINLNGQKIRLVTGWQPSIKEVSSKDLRLQAESFQQAQLWPRI